MADKTVGDNIKRFCIPLKNHRLCQYCNTLPSSLYWQRNNTWPPLVINIITICSSPSAGSMTDLTSRLATFSCKHSNSSSTVLLPLTKHNSTSPTQRVVLQFRWCCTSYAKLQYVCHPMCCFAVHVVLPLPKQWYNHHSMCCFAFHVVFPLPKQNSTSIIQCVVLGSM